MLEQNSRKMELITSRRASKKIIFYFLAAYFLLWIILFEFILPVNSILPKPSIVLISFSDLWNSYHLPLNYLLTIAAIYFAFAVSYFLLKLLTTVLVRSDNLLTNFIFSLKWLSDFVPGIILGIFLIFWFPESKLIEFVFSFFIVFISLVIKFKSLLKKTNHAYIDSAKSLGMNKNQIVKKIIWKASQPEIMNQIIKLNLYVWSVMIAFEFIKGNSGIGSIFRYALEFKDLSALFSISLITGITIGISFIFLRYIKRKFFFWSGIE